MTEVKRRKRGQSDPELSMPPSWGFERATIRILLLIALPLLAVVALIAAGRSSLERLRGHPRYDVPFAEIDCEPPPGQTREEFLAEVRYLNESSDHVNLLQDHLAANLAGAFAKHPWVEKVDRVESAPRTIHLRLSYRRPVLAVPLPDGIRAVDRNGVLLPPSAPTDGLPKFEGKAKPPAGHAGSPWGDPAVEQAAQKY